MAGGGDFHALKHDPAIERWAHMRENVYQTFTFTKRASRTAFALGLAVPAAIAAIAMSFDEKYDWAGKRREDSLYTKAPSNESA